MKITVGMATYRDFDGVYFTLQALRLYHRTHDLEIVVVDNAPDSKESQSVRDFLNWIQDVPKKYVPMPENGGTAQPRNRVFQEATGDVVMCMDSHVLLDPYALEHLRDFFTQRPSCPDLVHGPLVYDDLKNYSTHFSDHWEAEMWGQWDVAWRKADHDYPVHVPKGAPQTVAQLPAPMLPTTTVTPAVAPQQYLVENGYQPAAEWSSPFEIPAMGLGLFACRKEAWLGFNRHFAGFGGEEWYIHEKYRKAGHTVWCLPGLRWVHRFGRPSGVPYPLTRDHKLRNYLIGHLELGIPLDRLHKHFVRDLGFPQPGYDRLLEEAMAVTGMANTPAPTFTETRPASRVPVAPKFALPGGVSPSLPTMTTPRPIGPPTTEPPKKKGCGCGDKQKIEFSPERAQEAYERWLEAGKQQNDPLFPLFQEYSQGTKTVIEFGDRQGFSTVAFISSKPQTVLSHAATIPEQLEQNTSTLNEVRLVLSRKRPVDVAPSPCDLLFVDMDMTANAAMELLNQHGVMVRQRILFLGATEARGDGPGILPGVREWLKTHKDWTVKELHKEGRGLLVLTRLEEDKKALPSTWKQGWNFLKASLRAAQTGFGKIDDAAYERRLSLCTLCPSRNNDRCGECGCYIEVKASWPAEVCPLGKWGAEA